MLWDATRQEQEGRVTWRLKKQKGSSDDVDKNGEMPVAAGDLEKELLEAGDHEDSRCSSFWTRNFVAILAGRRAHVVGRRSGRLAGACTKMYI
jgi:hypothetical protein